MTAPTLPQIPQSLPKSQPDWQSVMSAFQQWRNMLSASKWTAPTLLNSWANFDAAHSPAGYYLDATNRLWLRGLVHSGASGAIAFQLPFVPAHKIVLSTLATVGSSLACVELDIDTSGNVTPNWTASGALQWVTLETSFSLSV